MDGLHINHRLCDAFGDFFSLVGAPTRRPLCFPGCIHGVQQSVGLQAHHCCANFDYDTGRSDNVATWNSEDTSEITTVAGNLHFFLGMLGSTLPFALSSTTYGLVVVELPKGWLHDVHALP